MVAVICVRGVWLREILLENCSGTRMAGRLFLQVGWVFSVLRVGLIVRFSDFTDRCSIVCISSIFVTSLRRKLGRPFVLLASLAVSASSVRHRCLSV